MEQEKLNMAEEIDRLVETLVKKKPQPETPVRRGRSSKYTPRYGTLVVTYWGTADSAALSGVTNSETYTDIQEPPQDLNLQGWVRLGTRQGGSVQLNLGMVKRLSWGPEIPAAEALL